MFSDYGINRVIEPRNVLPTSAWKIDNRREIHANELRISIRRLHIETTSFKQICLECNNDPQKIKERIMDIVSKRGKLHNPITDTGGVVYGVVEEIGAKYDNKMGLEVGDEVIYNVSLATIPLLISRISHIDMVYSQIEAEGYAIAFNKCSIIRVPEDIPVRLLLYVLDESGSIYSVSKCAEGKHRFLIVGNNLLTNMLFGFAVRRAAGKDAKIVCLLDKNSDLSIKGKAADELSDMIFSEIHHGDILQPTDCLKRLGLAGSFDVSVNCADIPGAETINVLATKPGGTVYFANFITNYNIAIYITESVSREIEIKGAEGYVAHYDEFDIDLVRQIAPYIDQLVITNEKFEDNIAYPLGNADKQCSKKYSDEKGMLEDFVYESRAMQLVLDEIFSVAKYDCNVLITGDTGVGKEKIASIIHKCSGRCMQPFVRINCAAISEHLMESEFFGYEKGAFTGANQAGKKGYFEMANNGIILLDEVGELPLDMQAKLLRAIQDGEFYRVGGVKPIKTNVRIISATNRNLEELVENKLFRRDLYYRLNVFPIHVPSLAERKSEIPSLVRHFVDKYNEKFGIKRSIGDEAIDYMKECNWPGNIRELENAVQRLMITAKGKTINTYDVMRELHSDLFGRLPKQNPEEMDDSGPLDLEVMVDNYEREIIEYALHKYGSSRKAAKAIGISQTQIVRKKLKYHIE